MRKITSLVIHTADTPAGKFFNADDIRSWHTDPKPKGRGWSDIGYHYVILLDGTIELGRQINVIGAHVAGHNSNSIGICYIGGGDGVDTRTVEQKESLNSLLKTLKLIFKDALILGHRDFNGVTKECPNFDAKAEYSNV